MFYFGSRYSSICIVPVYESGHGPVVDLDEFQADMQEELDLPSLEELDSDDDSLPSLVYDPIPTGYVRDTDSDSDSDVNDGMDMDEMVDMLCDEEFTFQ